MKKVIVLLGGKSAEKEVSLVSGEAVFQALSGAYENVEKYYLDEDMNKFINFLINNKDEIVIFNALHGKIGEDGRIQGLLDILKIPYTHSGVLASSLAMNKVLTKKVAEHIGILVAKDQIINLKSFTIKDLKLTYPFVIKPVDEGSSVGIYLINSEEELVATLKQLEKFHTLMLEEYIKGTECTVAVLAGKALTVTEIISKNKFYDYEAKYSVGGSIHKIPAQLDDNIIEKMLKDSEKMFSVLNARGVIRADFICNKNKAYLLEVNTQPGMTGTSLFPEQALYKGITFKDVCVTLVELAKYDE